MKKRILAITILIFLSFILIGCSSTSNSASSDSLEDAIIGSWKVEDSFTSDESDDNSSFIQITTFNSDNTFSITTESVYTNENEETATDSYIQSGTWSLSGDELTTTVTEVNGMAPAEGQSEETGATEENLSYLAEMDPITCSISISDDVLTADYGDYTMEYLKLDE